MPLETGQKKLDYNKTRYKKNSLLQHDSTCIFLIKNENVLDNFMAHQIIHLGSNQIKS